MPDVQLSSGLLKKRVGGIPSAARAAVGKLKAMACLNTFRTDSSASILLYQPFQEAGGRELVDCSKQAAGKRSLENASMAVYRNRRSSGSVIQRQGTAFTSIWVLSPGRVIW